MTKIILKIVASLSHLTRCLVDVARDFDFWKLEKIGKWRELQKRLRRSRLRLLWTAAEIACLNIAEEKI